MSEFETLERAKTFIKRGLIKIIRAEPERPFFVFQILEEDQIVTVSKSEKGWLCDGYENTKVFNARKTEAKMKGWRQPTHPWRCLGNKTDCRHILSAKILINDSSLGKDAARYTLLRQAYVSSQKQSSGIPQEPREEQK